MHRFLTAFLCLSTLALTQNVVAGTPSAHASLQTPALVEAGAAGVGTPSSSRSGLRSGADCRRRARCCCW